MRQMAYLAKNYYLCPD